jgi:hypothetical protein
VRVALALTGLLALVAVTAAGHRSGGGRAGRPSRAFFDYLFSAALVLMTVTAIAIVYVIWRERDRLPEDDAPARQRRTASALAMVLAIALLLVLAHRAGIRPGGLFAHHTPKVNHVSSQPGQHRPHSLEPTAHFRWLPALLVGVLFLAFVVLAALNSARRRLRMTERLEAAEEVALALDDSVDDLRAEPDARKAIIAAYARMERALGAVGLARRPAEAPLEYLARALAALSASNASVRRLTELFRIAKFSAHPLGPSDKESAIAALVAVRDELRSEA